ncbi:ferredoxin [candidate division WOR-3 bacterium JGI_Cruoil_03_51_56]|uniref:Ferredoxin n=1 Tax=candidate division WOR-3 bacterium JGI_Cruoil_03_51_56 TaxID=1973747 RepID=A0A235BNU1_UNCW3|nr:MAG: ferredoxin [candidate division WOR-3 bacterium JGI_Cruoil_03_51_56]
MKVSVNKDLCTGCELCVNTCPDLFEIDGDTAKAKVEVVPEGAEECARQAAEDCPGGAITVQE